MRHKNIFSDTWNVRARNALVGRLKGRGSPFPQADSATESTFSIVWFHSGGIFSFV